MSENSYLFSSIAEQGDPMEYDLIIIGAGAAGLFAGARASAAGLRFCILESMNQSGLKLLTSGSGQCNITNAEDIRSYPERYGKAHKFVKPALLEWSNQDLITFVEKEGLPCEDRGDGKIFPVSRNSRDVRDLLQKLSQNGEGRIFWKDPVRSIEKKGVLFYVKTGSSQYSAPKILLAAGGLSYPSTGSTGDSYILAERLGHSIVKPRPSLTPVFIKNFILVESSGSAFPVSIDLYREGKKLHSFMGDLLITHKGFSGPVILNNSRDMTPGDELRVSWLPDRDREDLDQDILNRIQNSGKKSLPSGLGQNGISESLMKGLLKKAGLSPEMKMNQLSKKNRISYLKEIFSSSFIVDSLGGFNQAMVTAGGVSLKEINPRTMESKLCEGLFFAGEVMDVDGETGGYNLQFAFSSAALAVKTMTAE
ncbi:aminoacetone oxidase family FAD-binding enzyme [Oceanispirochaeta sp. M1]|nr:aminoacetone oxidase family FAD-binding enzyme [Oceanispirochaeta sp. M1]